MVNYPLTPVETKVVAWTGRVIVVLAVTTIVLLGTVALTSS